MSFERAGEEPEGIGEVGLPVLPRVAARMLDVVVVDAVSFEGGMQDAIVFDQKVVSTAIESDRGQLIAVCQHRLDNGTISRRARRRADFIGEP